MSTFLKIWRIPDLRNKILFTLAMLAVYRVGIFISTPGVDRQALQDAFRSGQNSLFGVVNLFSGGAFEQASIFALGIMPYISASIIMQLMGVVIPHIEQLQKEGEAGRRKINQYTRYGTILLATFQGFGIAQFLVADPFGVKVVYNPTMGFYLLTMVTLVAGTTFVMWLGEQVTEKGIGNGTSLIIFAGIVAQMPATVQTISAQLTDGELEVIDVLLFVVVVAVLIAAIVGIELAYRRVPIQYPKQRLATQSVSSYLPLKVNITGVMPPIFASALLMFPATLAPYMSDITILSDLTGMLRFDSWLYNSIYAVMIVFFAFFWASIMFNARDVADNIKKQDGYVPGVRPGRQTAEYLDQVLSRITFGGALYLAGVCVAPVVLSTWLGVQMSFLLGGTGLLIVVSVALDTVRQIEAQLITQHYDGFAERKGPRLREAAG